MTNIDYQHSAMGNYVGGALGKCWFEQSLARWHPLIRGCRPLTRGRSLIYKDAIERTRVKYTLERAHINVIDDW